MRKNNSKIQTAFMLMVLAGLYRGPAAAYAAPEAEYRTDITYADVAEGQRLVFVFDVSGSMKEKQDLVKDIEDIFYSILSESPHLDPKLFCFDESLLSLTEDDWEPFISHRETNLLGGLEPVDNYLKNGKQKAIIILVSDLYDTYENKKMDPEADKERIEERKEKIEDILNTWNKEKSYNLILCSWENEMEKKAYEQISTAKQADIQLDGETDSFKMIQECFLLANRIRNGLSDQEWEVFWDIEKDSEKTYRNYFICAKDPIDELERRLRPHGQGELQEAERVGRILQSLRTEGSFYQVEGIPLSELNLQASTQKIYILPIPQMLLSREVYTALDEEDTFLEEGKLGIEVGLIWDGDLVGREELLLRVKYGERKRDQCDLFYDKETRKYAGFFNGTPGEYPLYVVIRDEKGEEKEAGLGYIFIHRSKERPKEEEKFMKEIRKIEEADRSRVSIRLNEYFEGAEKLRFTAYIKNRTGYGQSFLEAGVDENLVLTLKAGDVPGKTDYYYLYLKAEREIEGETETVYSTQIKLYR